MSFFREKTGEEINLILDMGNGSVAGALVLFKEGLAPKIIYSKRLPLSLEKKKESENLFGSAMRILEEVVALIAKDGVAEIHKAGVSDKKVRHTFCVLSSPWYISKTKILKIENREPISINKNFVDALLKKEQEIFEKEVSEKKYGNLSKNDIEIIEKKIIQTKLNGYQTVDPFKKRARQIELAIFMSVASKKILNSIESIVGKYFYAKHMGIFSYSFVQHNVISDIFSNESDFVFMDISAEVTDISSVEKHVLMETISFPMGRNNLIAKVAEDFGVLPEIALSFIKMNASGHAEEESSEKIQMSCDKAKKEWSDYFFKCLSDLTSGRTPSKVFLTVDSDVAPLFTSFVKENLSLAQKNSIDFQPIPVVLLNEEKLSQFVEFGGRTIQDPFLAIESVFFNKLFTTL